MTSSTSTGESTTSTVVVPLQQQQEKQEPQLNHQNEEEGTPEENQQQPTLIEKDENDDDDNDNDNKQNDDASETEHDMEMNFIMESPSFWAGGLPSLQSGDNQAAEDDMDETVDQSHLLQEIESDMLLAANSSHSSNSDKQVQGKASLRPTNNGSHLHRKRLGKNDSSSKLHGSSSNLMVVTTTDLEDESIMEEDNDAVKALAAKLAPTLRAAQQFWKKTAEWEAAVALYAQQPNAAGQQSASYNSLSLQNKQQHQQQQQQQQAPSPAKASYPNDDYFGDNDNDNLDSEMKALRLSEELLRQELEMAQDFSDLFAFVHGEEEEEEDEKMHDFYVPPILSSTNADSSQDHKPQPSNNKNTRNSKNGPPVVEADMDESDQQEALDKTLELGLPSFYPATPGREGATTTATPASPQAAEGIEVGLAAVQRTFFPAGAGESESTTTTPSTPSSTPARSSTATSAHTFSPQEAPMETATTRKIPPAINTDESAMDESMMVMRTSLVRTSSNTTANSTNPTNSAGSSRRVDNDDGVGEEGRATPTTLWGSTPYQYTERDHMKTLNIQRQEYLGWSITIPYPPSRHVSSEMARRGNDYHHPLHASFQRPVTARELCLSIPEERIKQLFVGLVERKIHPKENDSSTTASMFMGQNQQQPQTPRQPQSQGPLPVRTVTIQIRPDVLSGVVMEAVHTALEACEAVVRKRQGGHLQALVPGAVVLGSGYSSDDNSNTGPHTPDIQQRYPSFSVDCQLTTFKSDTCPRILLVRIYHSTMDYNEESGGGGSSQTSQSDQAGSSTDPIGFIGKPARLSVPIDDAAALHLREASALIQRVEAPRRKTPKHTTPRRSKFSLSRSYSHGSPDGAPAVAPSASWMAATSRAGGPNASTTSYHQPRNPAVLREVVSTHLREHYRACPSVKAGSMTLPALNAEDYNVIKSSWRWLERLLEELDTRDLTFASLCSARFGAFPALSTLDVQYCQQIRKISRETMVTQLLKSASELEEYAREAELACANMIALLRPTYEAYKMRPPPLPKPVPLTSYPFHFVAPQTACPPHGPLVQNALMQIQSKTTQENESSNHTQNDAVGEVRSGDTDESLDMGWGMENDLYEQARSLEMARAAVQSVLEAFNKQDDQEQSARLDRKNAQVMDRLAKMQAHQRLSIRLLAEGAERSALARRAEEDFFTSTGKVQEVPLLKWSIVASSGASGTCTVTANHVWFCTQWIPVLGGYSKKLFPLAEVEFTEEETAATLLSSSTTIIRLWKDGVEVYSFRPSMGGSRLKNFLECVKAAAVTEPLDLPIREFQTDQDC